MSKFKRLTLIALAIILVPVAAYYAARQTYYWGWWGRDNLWTREQWLCSAPPDFEQSLYPENVEVVISACKGSDSYVTVLPSGSKLFAFKDADTPYPFVLDIQTGEKTPYPFEIINASGIPAIWLTDDLFFYNGTPPDNKLHFARSSSATDIPHQDTYTYFREDPLPKPDELLSFIGNLQTKGAQIYVSPSQLVGSGYALLIAYYPDDLQQTQIIVVNAFIGQQYFEDWLTERHITYQHSAVDCDRRNNSPSPSGRYIVKSGYIYDQITNQNLISLRSLAFQGLRPGDVGGYYEVCGWLADESAAILMPSSKISLTEEQQYFQAPLRISQPILLFKIPLVDSP